MASNVILRRPAGLGAASSFGVDELTTVLSAQGLRLVEDGADVEIALTRVDLPEWPGRGLPEPDDRPESYAITRPSPDRLAVVGRDDNGLLYGCLDLAEQLDLGTDLSSAVERRVAPELRVRGVYLFLHNEEAEQGWVNDPAFWQSYADDLARYRFNRFNLIYGHQSPYLIPIYAFMLDDLDEAYPEIRVEGITPEERARHLVALQMASEAMASRGLTFFLGIWNSRPWKTANGVWETQATRVSGTDDLGRLVAYTRKGFTRLMDRCPEIGGIQLRMNIESGIADQRFFVQAFVPALNELSARGRRLTIELRNWGLHPDTIEAFRSTGLPIVVSTKYFAEHQGMPYQPPVMRGSYSYDSFLRKDKPFPFQWHLWNLGSHRLFAWGDPDYARRFTESCHLGDGVGFEMTPPQSQKGYSQWGQVTPGDWSDRTDVPARWAHQRYWFFHMAYGRMSYDPTTGDAPFLRELAARTTTDAAPAMLALYRAASQVVSYLISMRMDDPNMYVWPELDCGGPIDHNAIAPPGEVSLFATAREYAQALVAGHGGAKLSPLECARDLAGYGDAIEESLGALEGADGLAGSVEYRTVSVDAAALAALARYNAAKCQATAHLALFYETGDVHHLAASEAAATDGVARWSELCERTGNYYGRLHLGPSGGHWRDNTPRVEYDLRRIRRVRELFDEHGLFARGYDMGPRWLDRSQPRADSGMEPEPRFEGVDADLAYSPERGYGWLRTAGLRAVGLSQLDRDLLWGVHYIRPGTVYDPAVVNRLPLDSLTHRYLTADGPHTFRVDLPNGDYEVTLIAPAVCAHATASRVAAAEVTLGAEGPIRARVRATVTDGSLEVALGGEGPWALAGLVVRPVGPMIAHQPAIAVSGDEDVTLRATATGTTPLRSVTLRYCSGGDWHTVAMAGDSPAFRATIPSPDLTGDELAYEIAAEDDAGRTARRAFRTRVVRGFLPPRITRADAPETWSPSRPFVVRALVENGKWAQSLRLYYREADQNRAFQVADLDGGRSGEYVWEVDPRHLDGAYDLIYYLEVVDVLGGGSFYPDPFTDRRCFVCRPG